MNYRNARLARYLLAMVCLVVVSVLASCGEGGPSKDALDKRKQIAGELRDNKLYEAAIEEYQAILDTKGLSDPESARIYYLIARVYFEDIKDYRQAASNYLRARAFDPEGSFMNEASRNLVASLQKIGNVVDARRELSSATAVDKQERAPGDAVVADVGDKQIYRADVEKEIAALPADVQKQILSPEGKKNFLRQYVGMELLFRAADRENYLNDPEIVRRKESVFRNLVIEKYVVDRVMPEVRVDTSDVRNFYLANQDSRYGGQPYDSVRAQVFLDYQQEKAGAAYQEYINKLAEVEQVRFYDGNW